MDREGFLKAIDLLEAEYNDFQMNKTRLELWFESMKHLDNKRFMQLCLNYIKNSRVKPQLSDLYEKPFTHIPLED